MDSSKNTESSPSRRSLPSGREQRKVSNYLIDSKFQFKYALVSVFITFCLCLALAIVVLWQTSSSHRTFVNQRKRATDLVHKQQLKSYALLESMRQDTLKELSKVLRTASDMVSIHLKSKDKQVQTAAKVAKELLEKSDKERILREKKAAAALLALRKKADQKVVTQLLEQDKEWLARYEKQQRILMISVLIFGLIMIIIIFFFNIRFTHRAAGPLYKIRQYLLTMREGRLGHVGQLRKEDQLQEFHEDFRLMHESLVEQTQVDIEALTSAVSLLQQHGIDDPIVERLRKRLATKRSYLIDDTEELD